MYKRQFKQPSRAMMGKEFRLIDFNSNIAINNKKKIGDNVILDLFNYQGSNERVITKDYLLFNY
jgi:hypothetical protein